MQNTILQYLSKPFKISQNKQFQIVEQTENETIAKFVEKQNLVVRRVDSVVNTNEEEDDDEFIKIESYTRFEQ